MRHLIIRSTATVAALVPVLAGTSAPASADGGTPTCHGVPATWVGTPGSDRIKTTTTGLGRHPVLVMRGGDDRIAFDAADRQTLICLGQGDDRVELHHTTERRSTPSDSLVIDGSTGSDRVRARVAKTPVEVTGGFGDDLIEGGNAGDRLSGSAGSDRVFATRGDDRVKGGRGNDLLVGGDGDDRLSGGAGDDFLDGGIPNRTGARDRGDGGSGFDRCDEIEIALSCKRV